jgi:regulation of enolase protein 1 (concanavalin A-like superfamily)
MKRPLSIQVLPAVAFTKALAHGVRFVCARDFLEHDFGLGDVLAEKTVRMKISSDTRTVGFYYSLEGSSWQLIRLFKNDYPQEIWLGISAQSPMGNGTKATFEDVVLEEKSIADFRMGQ